MTEVSVHIPMSFLPVFCLECRAFRHYAFFCGLAQLNIGRSARPSHAHPNRFRSLALRSMSPCRLVRLQGREAHSEWRVQSKSTISAGFKAKLAFLHFGTGAIAWPVSRKIYAPSTSFIVSRVRLGFPFLFHGWLNPARIAPARPVTQAAIVGRGRPQSGGEVIFDIAFKEVFKNATTRRPLSWGIKRLRSMTT